MRCEHQLLWQLQQDVPQACRGDWTGEQDGAPVCDLDTAPPHFKAQKEHGNSATPVTDQKLLYFDGRKRASFSIFVSLKFPYLLLLIY